MYEHNESLKRQFVGDRNYNYDIVIKWITKINAKLIIFTFNYTIKIALPN